MDEIDGIFLGLCVAALATAVLLLAKRVQGIETDLELARIAGPVKTGGISDD